MPLQELRERLESEGRLEPVADDDPRKGASVNQEQAPVLDTIALFQHSW